MKLAPIYCAVAVGLAASEVGCAQFFDFNDGTAGGLVEYNPLAGLGMGGTYSFSDGAARLQHPGVPAELAGTVGQGRLGYVNSTSVSDFNSSVEILVSEGTTGQIGLVARVSDPGLGTSDGYALLYSFTTEVLYFASFADESPTSLGGLDDENSFANLALEAGVTYRMRFLGEGTTLTGIVEQATEGGELFIPVAEVFIEDGTYASGLSGILGVACECDPAGAVDVTFDNLFVAVPEPHEYAAAMGLGLFGFALYRRRRAN